MYVSKYSRVSDVAMGSCSWFQSDFLGNEGAQVDIRLQYCGMYQRGCPLVLHGCYKVEEYMEAEMSK